MKDKIYDLYNNDNITELILNIPVHLPHILEILLNLGYFLRFTHSFAHFNIHFHFHCSSTLLHSNFQELKPLE